MHNIVRTSTPVRLDLGGNYSVEIFTVSLRDADGNFALIPRAYVIDGGDRMEMISLVVNDRATIDEIRMAAQQMIKNNRGLNRLLDALYNQEEGA